VLHCSEPLSLVGVGVGTIAQVPALPGTAQDSPDGQEREPQHTNSSVLQTRSERQSVSLPHGAPGPFGVGVAVDVAVGLGVAVLGGPQTGGTVDASQFPDWQSVSCEHSCPWSFCGVQVPADPVMSQRWPAGHWAVPAGRSQQVALAQEPETHCAPEAHGVPLGCGVGVKVGVSDGVSVMVGVCVGVAVSVGDGVGGLAHVPAERLQAWPAGHIGESQQTPSVQLPESHCARSVQGTPRGLSAVQVPSLPGMLHDWPSGHVAVEQQTRSTQNPVWH